MKQCVIFDMDGVIIDSEPIHMACEREMFRLLGISVSDEVHHKMVGNTDEAMWTQLGGEYDLPIQLPELINLKKSLYLEYLKREVYIKPTAYISELIVDLVKNDFSLALASSSPHEQIDYILTKFGLKRYFQATISGEDVTEGKPYPEIFLKAAETLGCEPKSCLVIEDSYNGVFAAKSANMKCVGYINPSSGNQDLSKADMLINSFQGLTILTIAELLLCN